MNAKCDIAIWHFSHGCYLTARQTPQASNCLHSLALTLAHLHKYAKIFKYFKGKLVFYLVIEFKLQFESFRFLTAITSPLLPPPRNQKLGRLQLSSPSDSGLQSDPHPGSEVRSWTAVELTFRFWTAFQPPTPPDTRCWTAVQLTFRFWTAVQLPPPSPDWVLDCSSTHIQILDCCHNVSHNSSWPYISKTV